MAIQKSLQDERVVQILRIRCQVVAKFFQSWKKSQNLATAQCQKGLPCHKLKADCQTRWGLSDKMGIVTTDVEANSRTTSSY